MSAQEISEAYGFELKHEKSRIAHMLKPYAGRLALGCFLLLITNLITVCMPILINGGVSLIEQDVPFVLDLRMVAISFPTIAWIVFGVISLAIFGAIVRTFSRMVLFDVGRTIERDIRAKLFFTISTYDDRFYEKNSVGDLMNHLTTDVTNVRMVTGFAVLNLMNIAFVFCFTVPLLLKIDLVLGLCALLPFPLVILATRGITKRMFKATIEYQQELSKMASHIQENLLGAHVVRLFHQQTKEGERFSVTNQQTYHAGVKLGVVRALMMPVMRLMVGFAVGLVLYVGGNKIVAGEISLGDFVEVNARILQLAWPAMSVGFVMSVYSRGQASIERLNALLTYSPIIKDGRVAISSVDAIEVRDLVVKTSSATAHDALSFSVRRGELLGVVGPSGSYKTSLLKILSRRSWTPNNKVFYDGHDINHLSLSSLYRVVSVVPEESFLFNKSIRDNICFAQTNVSEHDLNEVLRITRLHVDIGNFVHGLDTIVGERGVTLSGGQRQRVAIARALLAKRPVIILDDALSSVDADTERHIVSALRSFLKDSLVIISTHRLSAIRDAEQIIVLEKGRIVERGVHRDLIKGDTLYASLWGINETRGRT